MKVAEAFQDAREGKDGSREKEIGTRIARAKNAFTKRKELLTKAFSLYLKKRLSSGVLFCMEPNRGDSRKMTSEGRRTVRCGCLEEGIKHFLVRQSL